MILHQSRKGFWARTIGRWRRSMSAFGDPAKVARIVPVPSDDAHLDPGNEEDLFRFTRGRIVINEEFEMAQRYIKYDVHALARIAANAVGSKHCIKVEKCPEGQYTKALSMTMNDGKEVIAKIPNPNAQGPHFTTASEVATMTFMREDLSTPVPKIYTWSSQLDGNPVGAEYVIMEKVAGVQLEKVWSRMDMEARAKIVAAIVRYQTAWSSCTFRQFGSLYFKQSLDTFASDLDYVNAKGQKVRNSRYSIGPSVGRTMFDAGRSELDLDRGPWNSLEDYAAAIGHRDAQCVRELPLRRRAFNMLLGPGLYRPSHTKKLRAFAWYDQVYKDVLPADPVLRAGYLWHQDMHAENIFVNADNPTEIVGITDWQSTEIAPLYQRTIQPEFLEYDGLQMEGLQRPRLPDGYKGMVADDKSKAYQLFLDQLACTMYRTSIKSHLPNIYRAYEFNLSDSYELLHSIQYVWSESGEALWSELLFELGEEWQTLPDVKANGNPPFPIALSESERTEVREDAAAATRGIAEMQEVTRAMGDLAPEMGIVKNENYEMTKEALRQLKFQVINANAKTDEDKKIWEEYWPFDD